jgi:hypothetical protein
MIMTPFNLRADTSEVIHDRRPELAAQIASRLQKNRPALRRLFGRENPSHLRFAVEMLLDHLIKALQIDQPNSFADIVLNGNALPAVIRLSLVDGATALTQISDTLKRYLPGPRGRLAADFIGHALKRLSVPEEMAA